MGEQNLENFILTLGNDNLLLSILLLSSPIGVFHNFLMTWVFFALLLFFFFTVFSFYVGFLTRTFTNHRNAGEDTYKYLAG